MVTIIYQHHATINFDKSVVAQLCLYIYHSDHLRDISGVRNFCLEGKSVVFPPPPLMLQYGLNVIRPEGNTLVFLYDNGTQRNEWLLIALVSMCTLKSHY